MSLLTRVLNFALITKLPHHHLPSLFHVHGVAVSPPARPRAAPSPLSPSLVPPKPLGLSMRCHLPARTPRTAVDAPRLRTRRAGPCATSPLACALCPALLPSICFAIEPPNSPLLSSLLQAPGRAFHGVQSRPPWPPAVLAPSSTHLRPPPAPIDPGNGTLSPQRSSRARPL